METLRDLQQASRAELVTYLESWGFACYDSESTEDLRNSAIENFETEGPGAGAV